MANDRGIGYWLTRRAQLSPRRRALIFEGTTLSYGTLNARVNAVAHALRGLGVSAGDRVAYLDLNHPDFLVTMFATAKLGAIFVPLNFRLTAPELSFIIRDASVHTLVHDAMFAGVVDEIRAELPCRVLIRSAADGDASGHLPDGVRSFESLLVDQRDDDIDAQVSSDDVAIIMYTSGTTGSPKGAMLTHGNLLWNNVQSWIAYDTSTTDITLVCAPLFHIGGLNVTTLSALTKGATVVLLRQYEPSAVLAAIAEHRVTTMFGVPAMFQFMALAPGFADADLSSVRVFICGGAPTPESLIRLYGDRGIVFVQGYGLTETSPFATIVPPDVATEKVGSAGLPPFFTEVRLVDDDDTEVTAPGERGEIVVSGPNVMKGYWNRPEATAEAIRNGWFHTGDIGTRDQDGFFFIVDRKKDMIISGGENIYPAEVEEALYAHEAIAEAAVIGVPDERWGEIVRAIVVVKPSATLDADTVLAHCQSRLARYKQPRSVVFVDVLPRNPAGKVLKFELRERYGNADGDPPPSEPAVRAADAPQEVRHGAA